MCSESCILRSGNRVQKAPTAMNSWVSEYAINHVPNRLSLAWHELETVYLDLVHLCRSGQIRVLSC
jgi:hypothetical protein